MRVVLSANSKASNLDERGRSLMYSINRRGPRIEPWGTPREMFSRELELLPMVTNCFQLVKYDRNHSSSLPSIPYLLSLDNKIS